MPSTVIYHYHYLPKKYIFAFIYYSCYKRMNGNRSFFLLSSDSFTSKEERFLFSGSIFPVRWLPEEANEIVLGCGYWFGRFLSRFFLFNALRSIEFVLVPLKKKQVGYRQRSPTKYKIQHCWKIDLLIENLNNLAIKSKIFLYSICMNH